MSEPWWLKGSSTPARKLVAGPLGLWPSLTEASARTRVRELRARRPAFTPDWADSSEQRDAGSALVTLFGEISALAFQRLNRLPDKVLAEFLQVAGVRPRPARPASALVEFTLAPAATQSSLIPKGFQVGARAASGELIVFETQDNAYVAPGKVAAVYVQEGGTFQSFKLDPAAGGRFTPLGAVPRTGDALLIGLDAPATPGPTVSLALQLATSGAVPPPVAAGGVEPAPRPGVPLLQWDVHSGSNFVPVEVLRDETRSLSQSGVVELRLPARWEPAQLPFEEKTLRWLRLRLVQGRFENPPVLAHLFLNAVRVRAVRTVRDEVLDAIPESDPPQMRLLRTPVVPRTVVLEVDAPLLAEVVGQPARWREVDDLSAYGPNDVVFTLDPDSGVVTFGDGRHGAALPPGFRHVRAVSYEVGGGAAGVVGARDISTLLHSAPFVTAVANPLPAGDGADADAQATLLKRGPLTLRTGNRAVTASDYAALAAGADVGRAHALAGHHPAFPGLPTPGVVNVVVVPARAAGGGPPLPDEATLRAVAQRLTEAAAPAGVEVVASAPRYRHVRTEVGFIADPAASVGEVVRRVIEALDQYLSPLTGGEQGSGWGFGQPLVYSALLRRLLAEVKLLRAVPRLRLTVDNVTQDVCTDVPLEADELFWPESHDVYPVEGAS